MSRADNLGALPFADYADNDPNRLPMLGDPMEYACGGCGAGPHETCREWCIGRPDFGCCLDSCGLPVDHDGRCLP